MAAVQPAAARVAPEPAAWGGREKEADMGRTTLITTVALAAALSVPAGAAAQGQDFRSPDARDAAAASEQSSHQDLRSPDARDAGLPPVQVPTPVVEIREVPESGFDWGDAGIGAAGMVALFSIAAGLALMIGARRRHVAAP
jgi:uncharacterized membrane protein YphA (DoxX/SURF4 family)